MARDTDRRTGNGGSGEGRPGTDGVPAGGLAARLVAARERKGVDLYRAERDTKIRARYLVAMENGNFRELPGAVYTAGFLRNYAAYLGLDAEDVIRQWRRERGAAAGAHEAIVLPPRPIVRAPRALTFSPSVVVAALMTIGIVVFGVYLAVQLLRFAKPPTLDVTSPITAAFEVNENTTTYLLAGTSSPGATVTVTALAAGQTYLVTVLSDGSWSVEVELRRGKNRFDITATDPETRKNAEEPRTVVITVPFLVIQAPTLTVTHPQDGTTFENGAIPVSGQTTNAESVVVVATYLGPPDGSTAEPTPAPPSPDPSAPPPAGEPNATSVPLADDGTFEVPLELTEGRWSLLITVTSADGKTASQTRSVTVAYSGLNLVVTISGGNAWLKVWVDDALDPSIPASGQVFRNGRVLTFTATNSIEVRTGSAGTTEFTLNGVSLGALGRAGVPETWLFKPPDPPVQTQRR